MNRPLPRRSRAPYHLVLFSLLGSLACILQANAQGPPPANVRVDPARLERVQEQRMVTGELRAVRKSRVATQEPGLVTSVAVEQGQVVRAGDVLATLDSDRLSLELQDLDAQEQVAIASTQQFQEELAWRERDLEMHRNLASRGAGNPRELNDAESESRIARAKLAGAQHQVAVIHARAEHLRKRIADMTIKAPYDGVIVTKEIEVGDWLDQGAAVAELISVGTIDAWLDVPQQFADAILNKSVSISIDVEAITTQRESSSVRTVPQVDSRSRTFPVIVRLGNSDGALAAGMSITGWVPTGDASEQITISKNGILRNEAGAFVYVARGTDSSQPSQVNAVPVQVMFAIKDRVVIRAGAISAGDLIVVEGNERLFPGMPVIVASAAANPSAPNAMNGAPTE